jgi:uncharacterized protein YwqG
MSEPVDTWRAAWEASALACAHLLHGNSPARSKLGGLPTIGSLHEWPQRNGSLLAFVAELDLGELSAAFRPDWLPDRGMLHFFYDTVEYPWGFDPKDRSGWAVLYSPDGAPVHTAVAPANLPDPAFYPEVTLRPTAAKSFPDPLMLRPVLGVPPDEIDDLVEQHWDAAPLPRHQVGGHPYPVQHPNMALDCQLASSGIYLGDPEGYRSAKAEGLKSGAADWRLLLQLDSDDAADMMWGDMGILYFWIREEDAKAGEFSRTWVILQCS